jgi:hypothetical protein
MSEWISVEDRLPEHKERVLGYWAALEDGAYEGIEISWRANSNIWTSYFVPGFSEITHWMPLPEPPEKTNEHLG